MYDILIWGPIRRYLTRRHTTALAASAAQTTTPGFAKNEYNTCCTNQRLLLLSNPVQM